MKAGLSSLLSLGVKREADTSNIWTWPKIHFTCYSGKRNKHLTSVSKKIDVRCWIKCISTIKHWFCFLFTHHVSILESKSKLHLKEALCSSGCQCNKWFNQRLHGEGCRHQTIVGQIRGSDCRSSGANSLESKPIKLTLFQTCVMGLKIFFNYFLFP